MTSYNSISPIKFYFNNWNNNNCMYNIHCKILNNSCKLLSEWRKIFVQQKSWLPTFDTFNFFDYKISVQIPKVVVYRKTVFKRGFKDF